MLTGTDADETRCTSLVLRAGDVSHLTCTRKTPDERHFHPVIAERLPNDGFLSQRGVEP